MSDIRKIRVAIQANDWDEFHKALSLINTQNIDDTFGLVGWTPLGYAAYHGRTRMVQALIRKGASINYADSNGGH